MQQQPQNRETITLDLPNGEKLSAPVGFWLAAVLSALPDPTRAVVNETVGNMIKQAKNKPNLQVAKPGHHVMRAEGFNFGARFGPNRNGGR